jgi:hypothetical protein
MSEIDSDNLQSLQDNNGNAVFSTTTVPIPSFLPAMHIRGRLSFNALPNERASINMLGVNKISKKVKFFPCLIKHRTMKTFLFLTMRHSMKIFDGMGCMAPRILNFETGRLEVIFAHWPQERRTRGSHWACSWVGPSTYLEVTGKRIFSAAAGNRPRQTIP